MSEITNMVKIPYEAKPKSLPDRNGDPIQVGDWVRTDRGDLRQVRELRGVRRHDDRETRSRRSEELDTENSTVGLVSYGGRAATEMAKNLNYIGRIETSAAVSSVERYVETETERIERDLRILEGEGRNLAEAKAGIEERIANNFHERERLRRKLG